MKLICEFCGLEYELTGNRKRFCTNSCRASFTNRATAAARIKHGHAKGGKLTKAYRTWASMKRRCTDQNRHVFKNYGGRGVLVSLRWLGEGGFKNFLSDLGEPPSPAHSIDRIDNDGDYGPDNCRWATAKQQRDNQECVKLISFNGETKTSIDWARQLGITGEGMRWRLKNWSIKDALSKPHGRRKA